jgi:uncharacterized protein YjiK
LDRPEKTILLPEVLNEVSGIAMIDADNIACVQDEVGVVFIYNKKTEKIVAQHEFESIGDFEGLALAGKSLFILRSDGRLSEWTNFTFEKGGNKMIHYNLALTTDDNEGLCFDSKNNRLLIAGKSKPTPPNDKTNRIIYAFDLSTKTLASKPAYIIDTNLLETKAKGFNLDPREKSAKGKVKPFNFRPSSIDIHPKTGQIFILSSADNMLIVINPAGNVLHMQSLNADRFPQPEGIAFLNDGTMLITNEAAGKVPTIQIFKQKL